MNKRFKITNENIWFKDNKRTLPGASDQLLSSGILHPLYFLIVSSVIPV
jgi:hypothetical protein